MAATAALTRPTTPWGAVAGETCTIPGIVRVKVWLEVVMPPTRASGTPAD
jgi:hypothetical protein